MNADILSQDQIDVLAAMSREYELQESIRMTNDTTMVMG